MISIDSILAWLKTLETGSGFWNPLVWGVVIVIAFLIVYIIRGKGKKEYKEKTEQTKAFLSGNPEYEKEKMHVPGGNVYWGFIESLKWIYSAFDKMHTGSASDYILWFVIILGIFFLVVGVI